MSTIRVLVGTKKGAFILTADGTRKQWKTEGPLFAGWEIYHMKGSPSDPNRIYASQTSGWFGQIIQRSDDGGKTWNPPGTKLEDIMEPDGFPKRKSNDFTYEGEVDLDAPEPVTILATLDALESKFPMLRGTIRDHGTLKRRPFIRFFACKEDLSLEPPETPLPEAVLNSREPFLIVGAMAGG